LKIKGIIIQNDTHTLKHMLSMDVAKCPLFSLTNARQLLHSSLSTLLIKHQTVKCRDRLKIGNVNGNKVWVLLKIRDISRGINHSLLLE
jgi:hypothetical protein